MPQFEVVSNNSIECRLWFSKPDVILRNCNNSVLEGGIHLLSFREIQTGDLSITLRCILTMQRLKGGNLTKVLSSQEKRLKVKAIELDFGRLRSMLAEDRWTSLRRRLEWSYTSSFNFNLSEPAVETVRVSHGSIKWELEVLLQRRRPFADPLFQLRREISVVRESGRLNFLRQQFGSPTRRESNLFHLASTFGIFGPGDLIQVMTDSSSFDVGPKRYSARCIFVQNESYFSPDCLFKPSKRKISLSTDNRCTEDGEHIWVPIESDIQSAEVEIAFQLPTCRQMRRANKLPFNRSCAVLSLKVDHHLEVSSNNSTKFKKIEKLTNFC